MKKRRNAIYYLDIDKILDKDGFELQIGDEFRDLNYNKIEGPITKIVTEITGSADESIKNIIYVNNKFYLLGNIEKIKKN